MCVMMKNNRLNAIVRKAYMDGDIGEHEAIAIVAGVRSLAEHTSNAMMVEFGTAAVETAKEMIEEK